MKPRIAVLAALGAFLIGLSVATFAELRIFLQPILRGAVVTLQISVCAWLLFLLAAFFAGLGRFQNNWIIKWIATIYIEVFRGTSLLVILFWLFFVMPEFGVFLSPFLAGVIGVGLNFGAYGAEVVRGALTSIPVGQKEASVALNIKPRNYIFRILVPQAVAIMIPGMVNLTIELIKATALVSAITLVDITYAAVQQNQLHFRTLEIFAIALLLYYCFAQFVRFGGTALEERFTRHLAKRY